MKSFGYMKAGVISRLASYLQFTTNPKKPIEVANTRALGAPNATQTSKGIYYPTVQGAIDDLAGRFELPVNTVITNDDGINPTFISQVDQIAITGAATETGKIKIFGIPVEVTSGDQPAMIATLIETELTKAIVDNFVVTEVSVDPVDPSILNITYNDYQNHVFAPNTQKGITLTQTTVVEPRPGYGTWEMIGTAVTTLVGGSLNAPITLYYFKRTA